MFDFLLLLSFPVLYQVGYRSPQRLLLAWLFVSPLSSGFLYILGVNSRVITFDRLALLASFVALAANSQLRDLFRPRFSKLEKAFLVFISVYLFEAVLKFPPRYAFTVGTNALDRYLIPFYLFLLTRYLLTRNGQYDDRLEGQLVMVLAIVGLYCAPMSIYEGLTGIDLLPGRGSDLLAFRGADRPRTNGPFWGAGVLGTYLSWTLLLVIYYWRSRRLADSGSRAVPRLITAPYTLLMLAGLYFVMFRNAWLSFLSGWLMRFVFTTKGRVSLLLVIVLAGIGYAMLEDSFVKSRVYQERISNVDTMYDRLSAWLYAFRAFSEHPLTGIGAGEMKRYIWRAQEAGVDLRFRDIRASIHPHNTIISQLAELGLMGTVPFLLLLWYFVGEVRGCLRLARSPADFEFGIYAVSAAVGIFATSLTDRSFEWSKSNNLMFLIFGLVAAHHIKVREYGGVEDSEVRGRGPLPEPVAWSMR